MDERPRKLSEPARECYILTCDIGERLSALRQLDLRVPGPDDEIVTGIQERIRSDLADALAADGCEVISLSIAAMTARIHEKLRENAETSDALVVSTFPEGNCGVATSIETNRIYSWTGRRLGAGPRPGFPPLIKQLEDLAARAAGRRISIVEDGIFSGSTIRNLIDQMLDCRLVPHLVVAGFAFPQSWPVLELLADKGIKTITIHEFGRIRDWVPDHDFIPFIPGSGRVVGAAAGALSPLYSRDGLSYSFPYVYPFTGDCSSWADWTGVSESRARHFSANRLEDAVRLFEHLESMNQRRLIISDLAGTQPRVSIPVTAGQRDLPRADQRVLDYLHQACVAAR